MEVFLINCGKFVMVDVDLLAILLVDDKVSLILNYQNHKLTASAQNNKSPHTHLYTPQRECCGFDLMA